MLVSMQKNDMFTCLQGCRCALALVRWHNGPHLQPLSESLVVFLAPLTTHRQQKVLPTGMLGNGLSGGQRCKRQFSLTNDRSICGVISIIDGLKVLVASVARCKLATNHHPTVTALITLSTPTT